MNIAYILADPGIGVFGSKGASVHVQEMIRALRHHGHHVTVFCVRPGEKDGTRLVPDDLTDLPLVQVPVPEGRGAHRETGLQAAAEKLAAEVRAGDFDLVYERYSLFSDAGLRTGLPMILEVNAPLIEEQVLHRDLADLATAHRLSAAAFRGATLVSCVSEPVATWVSEMVPDATVTVTPNGVNPKRISPARRDHVRDRLTVGFLGTLKPWHGTEILLAAVAATQQPWTLEFCGTGPLQESLRQQAEDLDIAHRVSFHGAVAPANVPDVLAGWDVACAPYPQATGHYFSPLKVYEYLAAGLPVIASAVGELPDLLAEDRGTLVPPGDTAALTHGLDRLGADAALRHRLGQAARDHVVAHHTWNRRCGELLAQLGTAADRHQGRTSATHPAGS